MTQSVRSHTGPTALIKLAQDVLNTEIAGLAAVRDRLNARTPEKAPLVLALGLLAACTGRVVVTGIGKSGLSAASLPPPFPRPVRRPSFSIPWKEPTEIWGASAKTTSSLPSPIPVKRRS